MTDKAWPAIMRDTALGVEVEVDLYKKRAARLPRLEGAERERVSFSFNFGRAAGYLSALLWVMRLLGVAVTIPTSEAEKAARSLFEDDDQEPRTCALCGGELTTAAEICNDCGDRIHAERRALRESR